MNIAHPTFGFPQRRSPLNRAFWRSFLCWKGLFILATVTAVLFAQLDRAVFGNAYAKWPWGQAPTLASRFSTWDAAHYLILSEQGYEPGSPSCAFYPLWPAAIRAASFLTFGDPAIASLVLANLLSAVALGLFFRLVARHSGEANASDGLCLFLASPGALFFSFPYTESLYLTLVMVFLLELERHRYFWPCVAAFLAPLTKAVGVFLVLPLAWHLIERRRPLKYWLVLLAPMLGYAAYFSLMCISTGNVLEGFDAQAAYPYSPSIRNMFDCCGFFKAFRDVHSVDGMMDSALDRGFFVLLVLLLPSVYRLNKTWFFYTLPVGLVPALTSYFMSYRRYIMVCFPVFILLAQLLARTKRRWLFWYFVTLLAALQVWAIKQFTCFNWAG